jgi:Heparinase II/III N-terminus/Heparinase II/III-like protein
MIAAFSPLAGESEVFDEATARLDDAAFCRYFLHEKVVLHPLLGTVAPEQIANAGRVVAGRFLLAGEDHALAQGFSWTCNPSHDKEWQIAHHKFYFGVDLVQAYAATGDADYLQTWIALMTSWLDEMGTGFIAASDAQVEAKRVENWITAYLALRHCAYPTPVPAALLRRFFARIHSEARYITQHLKPARNHRTFQLYAIFLAGCVFPEFRGSQALVESSSSKLAANFLSDFTPGGVHVERSTHYHNITLETALAFLELSRLNGIAVPDDLTERLQRALTFAAHVQFPDGEIPLLNDSDNQDHRAMFEAGYRLFGDPTFQWVASRGASGSPPVAESGMFDGYCVLNDTWGYDTASFVRRQHVVVDCAPLGEGSHSHYDLLNFCWFANGQQVVVDPGRYTYDPEPDESGVDWRGVFKSTASHNTVEIDGKDQTRYRSKAKIPPAGVERYDKSKHKANHGPDAEIRDFDHHLGQRSDWIIGSVVSHEYAPRHTRAVVFMHRQYVVVFDHIQITDGADHTTVLRFHLAAPWLERLAFNAWPTTAIARGNGWQIRTITGPDATAEVQTGWVSKAYGIKLPAPVLTVTQRGRRSLRFCSILFPDRSDAATMSLVGFDMIAGAVDTPTRVRVDLEINGTLFSDTFSFSVPNSTELLEGDLTYDGRMLACRRDQNGRLIYVQAAAPRYFRHLGGTILRDQARHLEWALV